LRALYAAKCSHNDDLTAQLLASKRANASALEQARDA
jgi:hypothetical protein